jgi:hypothetical protein
MTSLTGNKTLAKKVIKTVGSPLLAFSLLGSSLVFVNGCTPPRSCENPDGCAPTVIPRVEIKINVEAGTYGQPQTLSITSKDTNEIYYTVDGTVPDPATCDVYIEGTPIYINDSTILRIHAVGDQTNTLDNKLDKFYKMAYEHTAPGTGNGQMLTGWLKLEQLMTWVLFYKDPNDTTNHPTRCDKPNSVEALGIPQSCYASCPDGGTVSLNYYPYTTTMEFVNCGGYGLVANGLTIAELDVNEANTTGKVKIYETNPLPITISGALHNGTIYDNTIRGLDLIQGREPTVGGVPLRQGDYTVSCSDANCLTGQVRYWHTAGSIFIDDPNESDSCPAQ